jgi:hypothetical protein
MAILIFSTHLIAGKMKHPMFHTFALLLSNFSQIDICKESVVRHIDMNNKSSA